MHAANVASAATPVTQTDDSFELYDLRVEAVCPPGKRIMRGAKDGDYFTLEGEMLHLPPGQSISIYSLGSVLPLLAAKQRATSPCDWMSTDAEVVCPDPYCSSKLRIIRTAVRIFRHSDVTVAPLLDCAEKAEAKEPCSTPAI
ncbi:hypothetical protein AcW1_007853 [Taiwanofungus camphoratus]|nr:hypothetical protein AcV7_005824 [Antrodia cinnamomea]KAI0953699.1 hypothetical protein AcW1_007853 [Antrodia cinnamomea]